MSNQRLSAGEIHNSFLQKLSELKRERRKIMSRLVEVLKNKKIDELRNKIQTL